MFADMVTFQFEVSKNCFCTFMASLLDIYGEKQILRKLQRSSLIFFECEKVDLAAEIKIYKNISALGALYMELGRRLTNVCVCSMKTKCVCSRWLQSNI